MAAVGFVVSGCGALPASTGGGAAGGQSANSEAFSSCMRAHGVPGLPDLQGGSLEMSDRNGHVTVNGQAIDVAGEQFQAAQSVCMKDAGGVCRQLYPQLAAKVRQQATAMAACMRSHGVPNFPDPAVHGGSISVHITKGMGIDPNAAVFQTAQKACPLGPPSR